MSTIKLNSGGNFEGQGAQFSAGKQMAIPAILAIALAECLRMHDYSATL
jgi:hypothetical protein